MRNCCRFASKKTINITTMKLIYSLLTILTLTFTGFTQSGLYVKYETEIDATGEEGEMMASMMEGSTMELASNTKKTWVKTNTGSMMTMIMEMDTEKNEMTMLMTGMMGTMAFRGNPDDLNDEEEEVEADVDIELVSETKKILGHKCKKAIITDDEGNEAIYWYTEKFERPEGMEQMPNQVPGLCLEMELSPQEGISMKYTAIEFDDNADMKKFVIEIPEGTEVKSLEDMKNMGMGDN